MAVAYDQDVKLRVSVAADGGGDVENLAAQIEALGKDAGNAQPEFQKLAGELRQMAASQDAAETFRQLKVESQRLRTELDGAAETVNRLDGELTQSRAITAQAAATQAEASNRTSAAKARYDDLRISLMSAQNALKGLVDRSKEAGTNTEIYAAQISAARARVVDYKDQLSASRAEVRSLAADQKTAAAAVKEAESAERGLSREYSQSLSAARQLSAALGETNAKLDAARSALAAAGIDTKNLAAAQKSLNDEIAKAPAKLQALADAQRAAATQAQLLAEREQRLEQVSRAAGNSLNNAFGTLGIRSAAQINAEILDINQSLQVMARRADLTGEEFDRAFAAAQHRLATLRQEAAGGGAALEDVGRRAGNASSLLGKLGLAFTGLELARQFLTVNAELENVQRSFQAVTGSVTQATAEMEYARGVANRLGLDQIGAAKAYASLMAATKGTAAEGDKTRQVFESVSRAMSLAGKSAADTEGALLALQQMASKGIVSMEELRGQLGERLPGALNATAEGLGITTAQLIKLVESGQMTAEELFPALSAGLNKLYKDSSTETLTQEWQHFWNTIQDVFKAIGDAGPIYVLKKALEGLSAYISIVSVGFFALGQKIGLFLAGLKNGEVGIHGFSENLKNAFAEVEQEAQSKLLKTAQHNEVLAAMMGDAGKAAQESARNQREASAEATGAANDWTKLGVAFSLLNDYSAKSIDQAKKQVDATRATGEASIEAANALGGEADKHRAKAEAAAANAKALEQLAARQAEQSAIADAHLARMREEALAMGGATEQQQKVIDALTKTAESRRIDAEAAAGQSEKARIAAEAANIEAKSYDAARGSLSQWSAEKQAQLSVDQAGIRLAIEQQRTISEVARAKGDEYTASQALIEIKRLEIKLAELTAQAKMAEANATMASIQAQREELAAKGPLTTAKEAELKAAEAGAKVKQVEAQIAGETAKRMRELADAYQQTGGASRGAVDGISSIGTAAEDSVPGVDRLTQSLNRMSNAQRMAGIGSASTLENPNTPAGKSENSSSVLDDPAVRNRQVNVDLTSYLYKRGGSVEEVKAAQKYIGEFYARNQATMLTGNLGNQENYTRLNKQAINDAVDKALAAARQEIKTGQSVDMGTSVSDLIKRNLATADMSRDYTGDAGVKHLQRLIKDAGNTASNQTIKTIKLDIGAGSDRVSLFAEDEAAADRFMTLLERKARVSSRR